MGSIAVEAQERDMLLERLTNLRTIVPVFAEELASARRQLAGLRRENRLLQQRLVALESDHGASARPERSLRHAREARRRISGSRSRALSTDAG